MNSNHPWPNCGEVQCKQAHEAWNTILQMLDIECDDSIYVVGKAVHAMRAIEALKASPPCPNCGKRDMQLKVIRETKPECLRTFIHCNYCGCERKI